MRRSIQILSLIALLAALLFGQAAGRGVVTGTVLDSKNVAVARCPVVVVSRVAASYKLSVTTDAAGNFRAEGVPSGAVIASAMTANGVVRGSADATLAAGGLATVTIRIPAGK